MQQASTTAGYPSRLVWVLVLTFASGGCEAWRFYDQLGRGQAAMLTGRVPVEQVLQDENASAELKSRLRESEKIVAFADQDLLLSVGDRYSTYVALDRKFALWNIVAADEFSVEAKTWCYPFAGCAGYRGYFDETQAERHAHGLRADGYDVRVSGVPAYSTLGWFDDPLLSSFVDWPLPLFAGLLFHELAHSRLYLPGDTEFNEAFATFVERRGLEQWLQREERVDLLDEVRARWEIEDRFATFMLRWRDELRNLYQAGYPAFATRALKSALLRETVRCYQVNRHVFGGRYDRYFAGGLDNARFVALAAYRERVPAFAELFNAAEGDWARFFANAEALADLDHEARNLELSLLARRNSADQKKTGRGNHDRADEIQCQALAHHGRDADSPGAEHDDVGGRSDR